MSNLHISKQPAFSARTIGMRLLPALIYSALIPYLIYRVGTERYHLSAVNALLLAVSVLLTYTLPIATVVLIRPVID